MVDEIQNRKEIRLIDPVNYTEMISLVLNCKLLLTDSGGLQEETTVLGIRFR